MLGKVLTRAVAHSRLLTLSISPGSESSPATAADATPSANELRRFDTVLPVGPLDGAPPGAEMEALSEEPSVMSAGDQAAIEAAAQLHAEKTAELTAKVAKLRAELDKRSEVDDEAWRLQQAVQRQEEADSMKLLAFLRDQEDAFSSQLAEAKADVEAAMLSRMRDEQEVMENEYYAAVAELNKAHEEQMQSALEAAAVERDEAAAAAVAATQARMQAEHEQAMSEERTATGVQLSSLTLEVEALGAVLSHDTFYKKTSHATHQLSAAVLAIEESLSKRSTVPSKKVLQSLPSLAAALSDDLLIEATRPLAGKGADRFSKVPTVPQLATRFEDVSAAGRTASLVPEGSGMWGHALAQLAALLTLGGSAGGSSPLNISETQLLFSRAEECLQKGVLIDAVAEVRKLQGAPAAACKGWLQAAEERLLLEQILAVAKAESAIAMAALN